MSDWPYTDKQGNEITIDEYADLCRDPAYPKVAREELPNRAIVSTAWIGIGPLPFEVLVFTPGGGVLWRDKCINLEDARAAHKKAVGYWGSKTLL